MVKKITNQCLNLRFFEKTQYPIAMANKTHQESLKKYILLFHYCHLQFSRHLFSENYNVNCEIPIITYVLP